jgi:hypothetical protein
MHSDLKGCEAHAYLDEATTDDVIGQNIDTLMRGSFEDAVRCVQALPDADRRIAYIATENRIYLPVELAQFARVEA